MTLSLTWQPTFDRIIRYKIVPDENGSDHLHSVQNSLAPNSNVLAKKRDWLDAGDTRAREQRAGV
jgi:hypothetical protein